MKKSTKALLMTLCAVALVVGTLFGTLAYLTDSEAVTNTFTVGQVHIKLDEAPVDANGKEIAGVRVTSNTYKLIPGCTYVKDPTIHVSSDSEDCYLFVKVENNISAIEEQSNSIAVQMEKLGWKPVDGVSNVYVFAKEAKFDKYAVSKSGNVVVFNSFTIAGTADNAAIQAHGGKIIKVTAYAVQTAGFENTKPADIWKATFGA